MKTKALLFSITVLLLSLLSCGREEMISPFADVRTIAETQGDDPELTIVSGKFTFDEIEIDNPVGRLPVPIIGKFLQNLGGLFADIFIRLNENWEVDQVVQSIEIPELDPEYITSLQITNLSFTIIEDSISDNAQDKREANLKFIDLIEIHIATESMLNREETIKLATYHMERDKELFNQCLEKCIPLKIKEESVPNENRLDFLNLVPTLIGHKRLYVIPVVKIGSVPKKDFKIKGDIGYRLKIKLPF